MTTEELQLAEATRQACIRTMREGYAQAAASGLCDEGAFEAAVGAVQMLDLGSVVHSIRTPSNGQKPG